MSAETPGAVSEGAEHLHVEGIIGVLGGRAESWEKHEKRRGGQKPCVGVGRLEASRCLLQPQPAPPPPPPPPPARQPGSCPATASGSVFREAGCAQRAQFTLIRKN